MSLYQGQTVRLKMHDLLCSNDLCAICCWNSALVKLNEQKPNHRSVLLLEIQSCVLIQRPEKSFLCWRWRNVPVLVLLSQSVLFFCYWTHQGQCSMCKMQLEDWTHNSKSHSFVLLKGSKSVFNSRNPQTSLSVWIQVNSELQQPVNPAGLFKPNLARTLWANALTPTNRVFYCKHFISHSHVFHYFHFMTCATTNIWILK